MVIIVIVVVGVVAYVGMQQAKPPSQVVQTATSQLQTAPSVQKVDLILDLTPTGIVTPFYAGVDRGQFAKYGLQVNVLSNPQGSAGAIRALAGHKVDFAEADVGTLITLMAKENVTNVRAVALYYSKNPMGVQYIIGKDRAVINTPKDLEGKTVASFTGNSGEVMFPVLCKANGIDCSKISIEHVTVPAMNQGLLSGKYDAVLLYNRNIAVLQPDATKQGLKVGNFAYKDYGVDTYANMILTRTDIIQSNPDLVKRFIQGYEEALAYSIANPAEAVASTLKYNQQLNLNVTRGEWDITAELMGGKAVLNIKDPLMIGWIDPAKMSTTTAAVSAAYGVPVPNPSNLYTNQFVKQPQ